MFNVKDYLKRYRKRIDLSEVIIRDKWPEPPMVKSMEIILGDACNAKCAFCCAHESIGNWLSLGKVKEMINDAKENSYDMIVFSGGEPTIYPHFLKAVEYAKKLKFPIIEVMTNGIALADKKFAELTVYSGLTMAKVAIHSSSPQIHDKLTGVKGSFLHAIEAVNNLNALGVYTSTNMAINRLNYKHLPLYCDLFTNKMGLTGFCFYFGFYSGKMKNDINLQISYSELLPYLKISLDYIRLNKIGIDWRFLGNFVPCLIPECSDIMIDWGSDYKNRNNQIVSSGNKIQVSNMYDRRKIKMKKCSECLYGDICYGVDRLYLERYGEGEFEPVKKKKKNIFKPFYW